MARCTTLGSEGVKDSRVSQEEEVEHRMVLAEVDQCPTEHPATQGEQAEPSCDQNHIAEQGSTTALRHLKEIHDRVTRHTTKIGHNSVPKAIKGVHSVCLPQKLWSRSVSWPT